MKQPMDKEEVIDRLRKRMDWLGLRIIDAKGSPQRLTYDEAERSALRFAVEHLETCRAGELEAALMEAQRDFAAYEEHRCIDERQGRMRS